MVLITMVGAFAVTPFGGATAGRVRIGTDTVDLAIIKMNLSETICICEMECLIWGAPIGMQMLQDFGAWGEKKMYGKTTMGTLRRTFIFDENGILERIIEKVDTKNAAGQILSRAQEAL